MQVFQVIGGVGVGSNVHAADCIPTNTLLSQPLGPVIALLTGAFGGLLQVLAIGVAVVLAVVAIVTIMTNKAPKFLKLIALVLLIPIVLILAIAVYYAISTGINGSGICP